MAVFAVIQPQLPSGPLLEEKIKTYSHLKVRDGFWFVEAKATAQALSTELGVSSGETGTAIIIKVASYYGRADTNIWDWVQTHWE